MPGLPVVRAYHLIPAGASKARAVARHMQARGYGPEECIAVGDSREDMDAADVVGSFGWWPTRWIATTRSSPRCAGGPGSGSPPSPTGAGVYEAVVTTLAEGRG